MTTWHDTKSVEGLSDNAEGEREIEISVALRGDWQARKAKWKWSGE